jgi:hypothetical protein
LKKYRRSLIYIFCLSLVFSLSGCAFFKLKEELVELEETFGVRGKITYDTSQSGNVSELDLRAQAEADKMFGYNEDHGSILFNKSVLSKINDLLAR